MQEIERAHVIQAAYVVFVMMGDKNGVEVLYILAKHLLTKIGTGIDTYGSLLCLNENGGAQTFVARVCRPANVTVTTNYGFR